MAFIRDRVNVISQESNKFDVEIRTDESLLRSIKTSYGEDTVLVAGRVDCLKCLTDIYLNNARVKISFNI